MKTVDGIPVLFSLFFILIVHVIQGVPSSHIVIVIKAEDFLYSRKKQFDSAYPDSCDKKPYNANRQKN